jgi:hypothetical protein
MKVIDLHIIKILHRFGLCWWRFFNLLVAYFVEEEEEQADKGKDAPYFGKCAT